eukprot:TRINITY_DN615_c0_g1_i2.p1 TRINITY_DN615_c0_g1~~TRINITY_DN615_c0_g1_i2.p1  ORF type:complete len:517 (+),score=70.24 TRINITY_DN615_c0_g1_i2:99-1649(+)
MSKEIVSTQIGTFANYVGAHFWNLQDEYLATPIHLRQLSPAPLFREVAPSTTAYRSGLRYAPRLQVIDSTGAFGALCTQAGMIHPDISSETKESVPAWAGRTRTYVRPRIQPSAYIRRLYDEEKQAEKDALHEPHHQISQLEHTQMFSNTRYWSDFLKVRLHPRTCTSVNGVHHHVTNLDHFETGHQLASPLVEDWYNDLRFFVEDCDSFGGLNIFTNADDAFAGMTAAYLSHIMEELGTSSLLLFGIHHSKRFSTKASAEALDSTYDPTTERIWSQNEATLAALCHEYVAEYVPLSCQIARRMPMLHFESDLFQPSAALALAIDVSSTPLRFTHSLSDVLSLLRPAPFATFGSLLCNIPNSNQQLNYGRSAIQTKGTLNYSDAWKPSVDKASPEMVSTQSCAEVVSSRGISHELPIHTSIDLPVALPIPFPSIFHRDLLGSGPKKVVLNSTEGVQLEQVSAVAGLATVPQAGSRALQALSNSLKSMTSTQQRYGETDFDELGEVLQSRSEDYDTL